MAPSPPRNVQCDAYEYTDKPMGAYGNGERGVHIAFEVGAAETSPRAVLLHGGVRWQQLKGWALCTSVSGSETDARWLSEITHRCLHAGAGAEHGRRFEALRCLQSDVSRRRCNSPAPLPPPSPRADAAVELRCDAVHRWGGA